MEIVKTLPAGLPEFTLGWGVLSWCSSWLRQPDGPDAGTPWRFTAEQVKFVLWWYAVDDAGRFLSNRGVLRRAKGWGKSPVVAALALAELCGPVRFSRFDPAVRGGVEGREVAAAWVQLAGVSEKQTQNTMTMVTAMVAESPIREEYGLDVGLTRTYSGSGGRLEPITASAPTAEGARPTFIVEDETHWWTDSNGGAALDRVNRRNVGKSRDGSGRVLETTNAHAVGLNSVAERSFKAWQAGQDGTASRVKILYDSVEPALSVDMAEGAELAEAIKIAYGDAHWIDPLRVMDEALDPGTPPGDSRRFYLNQVADSDEAMFVSHEWDRCKDVSKIVLPGEAVTLGFDGSRGRARGKPDATAIIGCRVSDAHLFEVGVWEAVDGPGQDSWTPPISEIEAALAECFGKFNVVGFYADPARDWRSHVNKWEAEYGSKITPKMWARAGHPFEWWMTGGRSGLVQLAVESFEGAVRNQDLSHDGSYKLTQHILNARRSVTGGKLKISKEHDYSPNKIDAADAAVLALQARMDAVGSGAGRAKRRVSFRRF